MSLSNPDNSKKPFVLDQKYWDYVDQLAEKYGVPKAVWEALVKQESSSGKNAKRSSKGAEGIWQIIPGTARGLGVNANDPYQAADGALRLLRDNYLRFRARAKNEMHAWMMATAGYHTNPNNVERDLNKGGWGVPGWKSDGAITTEGYVNQIFKNITGDRLDRRPQGAEKFIAPPPMQNAQVDVPTSPNPYPVAPPPQSIPATGDPQALSPFPQGVTTPLDGTPSQPRGILETRRARMQQPAAPSPEPDAEPTTPSGPPLDWTPTNFSAANVDPDAPVQSSQDGEAYFSFERSGVLGDLKYLGKQNGVYRFQGKNSADIYTATLEGDKLTEPKPENDGFVYFQNDPTRWTRTGDGIFTSDKNGQRIMRTKDTEGKEVYTFLNLPNVIPDSRPGKEGKELTITDDGDTPEGFQAFVDTEGEIFYGALGKPIVSKKDFPEYLDREAWRKTLPKEFQNEKPTPRVTRLEGSEYEYTQFLDQYGLEDSEEAAQWFSKNGRELDRTTRAMFMRPRMRLSGGEGKPANVLTLDTNQTKLEGPWFRYRGSDNKTYVSDGRYTIEEKNFNRNLTDIVRRLPSGFLAQRSSTTFRVDLGDRKPAYEKWREANGVKADNDEMRQLFLDAGGRADVIGGNLAVVEVRGADSESTDVAPEPTNPVESEQAAIQRARLQDQLQAIGDYKRFVHANTVTRRVKTGGGQVEKGTAPPGEVPEDFVTENDGRNPFARSLGYITYEQAQTYGLARIAARDAANPNLTPGMRREAMAKLEEHNANLMRQGLAPIVDPVYGTFKKEYFLNHTAAIRTIAQTAEDADLYALVRRALRSGPWAGITFTDAQVDRLINNGPNWVVRGDKPFQAGQAGQLHNVNLTWGNINTVLGGSAEQFAAPIERQFRNYYQAAQFEEIRRDFDRGVGDSARNLIYGRLTAAEQQAREDLIAKKLEEKGESARASIEGARSIRSQFGGVFEQTEDSDPDLGAVDPDSAAMAFRDVLNIESRYGSVKKYYDYQRTSEVPWLSEGVDRTSWGGYLFANTSDAIESALRTQLYVGKHAVEGFVVDGPMMILGALAVGQGAFYSLQTVVESTYRDDVEARFVMPKDVPTAWNVAKFMEAGEAMRQRTFGYDDEDSSMWRLGSRAVGQMAFQAALSGLTPGTGMSAVISNGRRGASFGVLTEGQMALRTSAMGRALDTVRNAKLVGGKLSAATRREIVEALGEAGMGRAQIATFFRTLRAPGGKGLTARAQMISRAESGLLAAAKGADDEAIQMLASGRGIGTRSLAGQADEALPLRGRMGFVDDAASLTTDMVRAQRVAFAKSGFMSFGSQMYETMNTAVDRYGATPGQAYLFGLLGGMSSFVEGASDVVTFRMLRAFRGLDALSGGGFTKTFASKAAAFAKQSIGGGLTETAEEFVQGLWTEGAAAFAGDPTKVDRARVYLSQLDDIFYQALPAFFAGAAMGGGGLALNIASNRNIFKPGFSVRLADGFTSRLQKIMPGYTAVVDAKGGRTFVTDHAGHRETQAAIDAVKKEIAAFRKFGDNLTAEQATELRNAEGRLSGLRDRAAQINEEIFKAYDEQGQQVDPRAPFRLRDMPSLFSRRDKWRRVTDPLTGESMWTDHKGYKDTVDALEDLEREDDDLFDVRNNGTEEEQAAVHQRRMNLEAKRHELIAKRQAYIEAMMSNSPFVRALAMDEQYIQFVAQRYAADQAQEEFGGRRQTPQELVEAQLKVESMIAAAKGVQVTEEQIAERRKDLLEKVKTAVPASARPMHVNHLIEQWNELQKFEGTDQDTPELQAERDMLADAIQNFANAQKMAKTANEAAIAHAQQAFPRKEEIMTRTAKALKKFFGIKDDAPSTRLAKKESLADAANETEVAPNPNTERDLEAGRRFVAGTPATAPDEETQPDDVDETVDDDAADDSTVDDETSEPQEDEASKDEDSDEKVEDKEDEVDDGLTPRERATRTRKANVKYPVGANFTHPTLGAVRVVSVEDVSGDAPLIKVSDQEGKEHVVAGSELTLVKPVPNKPLRDASDDVDDDQDEDSESDEKVVGDEEGASAVFDKDGTFKVEHEIFEAPLSNTVIGDGHIHLAVAQDPDTGQWFVAASVAFESERFDDMVTFGVNGAPRRLKLVNERGLKGYSSKAQALKDGLNWVRKFVEGEARERDSKGNITATYETTMNLVRELSKWMPWSKASINSGVKEKPSKLTINENGVVVEGAEQIVIKVPKAVQGDMTVEVAQNPETGKWNFAVSVALRVHPFSSQGGPLTIDDAQYATRSAALDAARNELGRILSGYAERSQYQSATYLTTVQGMQKALDNWRSRKTGQDTPVVAGAFQNYKEAEAAYKKLGYAEAVKQKAKTVGDLELLREAWNNYVKDELNKFVGHINWSGDAFLANAEYYPGGMEFWEREQPGRKWTKEGLKLWRAAFADELAARPFIKKLSGGVVVNYQNGRVVDGAESVSMDAPQGIDADVELLVAYDIKTDGWYFAVNITVEDDEAQRELPNNQRVRFGGGTDRSDPSFPSSKAYPTRKAALEAARQSALEDLESLRSDEEAQDVEIEFVDEKPTGTTKTVFAGDIKTEVDLRVVAADDLITSDHPDYPAELQPRDTNRKASAAFISKIANELDPLKLDDETFAGNGRPIVVPVMINGELRYAVIAGNHRVAAIKLRYGKGNNDEYAAFAASKDPDAVTVEDPIYVGVLFAPESIDLVAFARAANEAQQRGMSATEQAVQDAQRLTADMLGSLMVGEDGDLNNAANLPFIRKFMAMVGSERASMYTRGDGMLNQDGVRAMRNAVFAAAYGQTAEGIALLEQMSESEDANIKRIIGGLLTAAPRFAQMKADIVAGAAYPQLDISAAIGRAAIKMANLRQQGMPVSEYLNQQSLFGELELSELERQMLQVLDKYKNSAKAIREVLHNYLGAVSALGAPNQINMFGEIEVDPISVMQGVMEDYEQARKQGEAVDLFSSLQNTAPSGESDQEATAGAEADTYGAPGEKQLTEKEFRKKVRNMKVAELEAWLNSILAATGIEYDPNEELIAPKGMMFAGEDLQSIPVQPDQRTPKNGLLAALEHLVVNSDPANLLRPMTEEEADTFGDDTISRIPQTDQSKVIMHNVRKLITYYYMMAKAEARQTRVGVELNAQAAALVELALGIVDPGNTEVGGLFLKGLPTGSQADRIINVLRGMAQQIKAESLKPGADPVTKEAAGAIERLADTIARGRDQDGNVIVYLFDTAVQHERLHYIGTIHALSKRLADRHTRAGMQRLVSSPEFKKAWKVYVERYLGGNEANARSQYLKALKQLEMEGISQETRDALEAQIVALNRVIADAVEEIAVWSADGDFLKMGLTSAEAATYLDNWFTSYEERNGVSIREQFAKESAFVNEIQKDIRRAVTGYNATVASRQSNGDVSAVATDWQPTATREVDPSFTAESEAEDGISRQRDLGPLSITRQRDVTPSGINRLSATPVTMATRIGVPPTDRLYVGVTTADIREYVDSVLDQGLEDATLEFFQEAGMRSIKHGGTIALGYTLANIYDARGNHERATEIKDILEPWITEMGQAISFIGQEALYNPDKYVGRMKRLYKKLQSADLPQDVEDLLTDAANEVYALHQQGLAADTAINVLNERNRMLLEREQALTEAAEEMRKLRQKVREQRRDLDGGDRRVIRVPGTTQETEQDAEQEAEEGAEATEKPKRRGGRKKKDGEGVDTKRGNRVAGAARKVIRTPRGMTPEKLKELEDREAQNREMLAKLFGTPNTTTEDNISKLISDPEGSIKQIAQRLVDDESISRQIVYHGSGAADIDEQGGFNARYVSSANGIAYGWGHYVADLKKVAEGYREGAARAIRQESTGEPRILFDGYAFGMLSVTELRTPVYERNFGRFSPEGDNVNLGLIDAKLQETLEQALNQLRPGTDAKQFFREWQTVVKAALTLARMNAKAQAEVLAGEQERLASFLAGDDKMFLQWLSFYREATNSDWMEGGRPRGANELTPEELRARYRQEREIAVARAEGWKGQEDRDVLQLEVALDFLKTKGKRITFEPAPGLDQSLGAFYQLRMAPTEEEMLWLDGSFASQSQRVRDVLEGDPFFREWKNSLDYENGGRFTQQELLYEENIDVYYGTSMHQFYQWLEAKFYTSSPAGRLLESMVDGRNSGGRMASMYLLSLGIRGNRFFNGFQRDSKGREPGKGRFNYVVFNDADLAIIGITHFYDRGYFFDHINRPALFTSISQAIGDLYQNTDPIDLGDEIAMPLKNVDSVSGPDRTTEARVIGNVLRSAPTRLQSLRGRLGLLKGDELLNALQDEGLGETPLKETSTSYFTAEAFRNAGEGPKSRRKIVMMPIRRFLALTPALPDGPVKPAAEEALKAGRAFTSLPMLITRLDSFVSVVKGHEGRHRALALQKRGVEVMPVIIEDDHMRWSEQDDPSRQDYSAEFPENIMSEDGSRHYRHPIETRYEATLTFDQQYPDLRAAGDEPISRMVFGQRAVDRLSKASPAYQQIARNMQSKLTLARSLETMGKDPDSIWLATGWEKGADGRWRSETQDVPLRDGISWEPGKDYWLDDVLADGEYKDLLFAMYPELRTLRVEVAQDASSGDANYQPYSLMIEVGRLGNPEADGGSALYHEIQHAVQHIEGFAPGDSTSSPTYLQSAGEVEARNVQLRLMPYGLASRAAFNGRAANLLGKKRTLELMRQDALRLLDEHIASEGALGFEFDPASVEQARQQIARHDFISAAPIQLRPQLVAAQQEQGFKADPLDLDPKNNTRVYASVIDTLMGEYSTEDLRKRMPLSATEDTARDKQVVKANSYLASRRALNTQGAFEGMPAQTTDPTKFRTHNWESRTDEDGESYLVPVSKTGRQLGVTGKSVVTSAPGDLDVTRVPVANVETRIYQRGGEYVVEAVDTLEGGDTRIVVGRFNNFREAVARGWASDFQFDRTGKLTAAAQLSSEIKNLSGDKLLASLRGQAQEDEGVSRMIVGEKGVDRYALTDPNGAQLQKNLPIAKQMRDAGMDPMKIWVATGWEFDEGDGFWKAELGEPDIKKDYIDGNKGTTFWLEEAMEDGPYKTALLSAYPQMRGILVSITSGVGALTSGQWESNNARIALSVYSGGGARQSTLYHEIQHYIQGAEGFSGGGSPSEFSDIKKEKRLNKFYRQYLQARTKLEEALDKHRRGLRYPVKGGIMNIRTFKPIKMDDGKVQTQWTPEELAEVLETYDLYEQDSPRVKGPNIPWFHEYDTLDLKYGGSDISSITDANDAYYRLGGEAESRNVQRRARQTNPYLQSWGTSGYNLPPNGIDPRMLDSLAVALAQDPAMMLKYITPTELEEAIKAKVRQQIENLSQSGHEAGMTFDQRRELITAMTSRDDLLTVHAAIVSNPAPYRMAPVLDLVDNEGEQLLASIHPYVRVDRLVYALENVQMSPERYAEVHAKIVAIGQQAAEDTTPQAARAKAAVDRLLQIIPAPSDAVRLARIWVGDTYGLEITRLRGIAIGELLAEKMGLEEMRRLLPPSMTEDRPGARIERRADHRMVFDPNIAVNPNEVEWEMKNGSWWAQRKQPDPQGQRPFTSLDATFGPSYQLAWPQLTETDYGYEVGVGGKWGVLPTFEDAAIRAASVGYHIAVNPSSMTTAPANVLGDETISRMAKKEADEKVTMSLGDLEQRIPAGLRVAAVHTPGTQMRTIDGKLFQELDLTRRGRNPELTDDVIDRLWADAVKSSAQEGALIQDLLDKGMKPRGAEFWNNAVTLPDRARYWYEISAEAFQDIFEGLNDDQMRMLISIISATSPSAVPDVNLRRALGVFSEILRDLPIDTDVIDLNALERVFSEGLQGLKTASFAGTMQYTIGLTDTKPLTTNDRQVASSFNITGNNIAGKPAVYEVLSRFYMNLRDHLNANLQPGEQPYEAWQLQALGWVQERYDKTGASNDDYLMALENNVLPMLREAGIISGNKISLEALKDPRLANLMSSTRERFQKTSIASLLMLEYQSPLGRRVQEVTARLLEAGLTQYVFGSGSQDSLQDIQNRYFDLIGDRKNGNPSLATKLAHALLGRKSEPVPDGKPRQIEITRVRPGEIVRSDERAKTLRLPLKGLSDAQREMFVAVFGKATGVARLGETMFIPAEWDDAPIDGHVRTASIFALRQVTQDEVAALEQALGKTVEVARYPHGTKLDIVPQNFAGVTFEEVLPVAEQMFPEGATIGARDFKHTSLVSVAQNEGDKTYAQVYNEYVGGLKNEAVKEIIANAAPRKLTVGVVRKYVDAVVREHLNGRDGSAITPSFVNSQADQKRAASTAGRLGSRISDFADTVRATQFVFKTFQQEVGLWLEKAEMDLERAAGNITAKERAARNREINERAALVKDRRDKQAVEMISRSVTGRGNPAIPQEMIGKEAHTVSRQLEEGVSRMADIPNPVTQYVNPNEEQMNALVEVMTLELHRGLIEQPMVQFVKRLRQISNNTLSAETMAHVHQKAVANFRTGKKRKERTPEQRAASAARRQHYKAADAFADIFDPDLQESVSEFLKEVELTRRANQERVEELKRVIVDLQAAQKLLIENLRNATSTSERESIKAELQASRQALRVAVEEMNRLDNRKTPTNARIAMMLKLQSDPIQFAVAYLLITDGADYALQWLGTQGFNKEESYKVLRDAEQLLDDVTQALENAKRETQAGRSLTERDHETARRAQRTNRREKQKVAAKHQRIMQAVDQPGAAVAMRGFANMFRAGLLAHPQTISLNLVSNLANLVLDVPVTTIASMADRLAASKTGKRSRVNSMKGYKEGFKALFVQDDVLEALDQRAGFDMAWHILRYGDSDSLASLQLSESNLSLSIRNGYGKRTVRVLDAYINLVFNTMGAGDALFKVYVFRKELENLARLEAMNEGAADVAGRTQELLADPSEAMAITAMEEALNLTYQSENALSGLVARGRAWLGRQGTGGAVAAEASWLVVPFDRTPTNLIAQTLFEYSPIGFARAFRAWNRMFRPMTDKEYDKLAAQYWQAIMGDLSGSGDFVEKDPTEQREIARQMLEAQFKFINQRRFAQLVGRATVGTSNLILGIILGYFGLLKGLMWPPRERDEEEREEGEERKERDDMQGELADYFRLPDTPGFNTMVVGATMGEDYRREEEKKMAWTGQIGMGVSSAANAATLQGLQQPLLRAFTEGVGSGRSLGSMAGQYSSILIPGSRIWDSIGEIYDPKERKRMKSSDDPDRSDVDTFFSDFGTAFKTRLPFVRESVEEDERMTPGFRGGKMQRLLREVDPLRINIRKMRGIGPYAPKPTPAPAPPAGNPLIRQPGTSLLPSQQGPNPFKRTPKKE